MKTMRAELMRAAQAVLIAWPGLAGVSVRLSERRPMAEDLNRQIRIFHEQSNPAQGAVRGAPVDWNTSLRFECIGREMLQPAQAADDVADDLLGEVYAALMSDVSLGGKTQDIVPGAIITTEDDADKSVTAIQIIFTLKHRTQEHSIGA